MIRALLMHAQQLIAATVLLVCSGSVRAQAPSESSGLLTGNIAGETAIDRIWSAGTLYKNANNPYVQEFSLIGQLQLQYAAGSDDSGNFGSRDRPDDSTWGNTEVRRIRLGAKGRILEKLTFLNLMDLYPDMDPRMFKRMPEMYFTYTQSDAFNLSLGKTEMKFNREQEYSSKDFLPFERSALGNMVYAGELTGVWICGKGIAGGWLYYLGAFSNDRVDEITHFDGGAAILGKIGYNYTRATGFDLAEVKVQWMHNTEPGFREASDDLASPQYSNNLSVSNQITAGAFDLTTEFLWADGENGLSDVWGLGVMANYLITPELHWINTLEYAASTDENGVFLPARYEALAPTGDDRGDSYFAAYSGLNYYINSHKLKLMSGVKFSQMDGGPAASGDFNGWTWLCGVRFAF